MYVLGKGIRERKFHPYNSNGVEGGIWKRLRMNDVVQKGGSFRKEQSLPKDRVSNRFASLEHLLNKTYKPQAWEAPCWGSENGKNQPDCCRSYAKQRRSLENSPERVLRGHLGKTQGLFSLPEMECEQGCVCPGVCVLIAARNPLPITLPDFSWWTSRCLETLIILVWLPS